MTDWRDSVKVWKVESFFGKWIVRPDDSEVAPLHLAMAMAGQARGHEAWQNRHGGA